jgi:hypothetical protein
VDRRQRQMCIRDSPKTPRTEILQNILFIFRIGGKTKWSI